MMTDDDDDDDDDEEEEEAPTPAFDAESGWVMVVRMVGVEEILSSLALAAEEAWCQKASMAVLRSTLMDL